MPYEPLLANKQATRQLRKRVNLPNGSGFTTEADGNELLTYSVWIDHTELVRYAIKAATHANGKTHVGPLQIRITDRQRTDLPEGLRSKP